MTARRVASVFPLLLLLLFPREGPAQETITLDEAITAALASHESVGIAGEAIVQAESEMDRALSVMLPQLKTETVYTRYSEEKSAGTFLIQPEEATRFDLKLTQSIYTGGREWSARRQARFLRERSREGLGSTKESVILDTSRAYIEVLKAQKDVEIKEAAMKRAEERKKVSDARFAVGEVTKADVLRAQAELSGAEAETIRARNTLEDAKNVLRRFLNMTGDFAVAEPEIAPVAGSVGELVVTAHRKRLDLRQTSLDRDVAEEGIRFARGGFLPTLSLEGLYQWRDQDPKTTFFQEEQLSASLILTYPLFEGGLRKAELDGARSRLRETELRLTGLKRDIEVEVREAYNRARTAEAVIESFKRQVAFAEENYRMVFEQFKFGLATTVDVIDADTELTSAQSSLSSSVYDFKLAQLELKFATGLLLEETAAK